MIALDRFLAARSRRRHRLPEEPQPRPACVRMAFESIDVIASRLRTETDGAFKDAGDDGRRRIARRLRWVGWLVASGRMTETIS